MKKDSTVPSKTTKKSVVRFLLIILVSALVGGVVGAGVSWVGDASGAIGDNLNALLAQIAFPLQLVVFVGLAVASALCYGRGKLAVVRLEKSGHQDDKAEEKGSAALSWGVTLSNLNMILCYGLFGVMASLPMHIPTLLCGVAVIIAVIAWTTAYQVKGINLVKRLNPEKDGDPLSLKFEDKWMASCDEAERMVIYQAAYRAFRLLSKVIMALWLLTVILSTVFPLGAYPIVLITIIWLAHTIGYQWYTIKLGTKKLEQ